MKAIVGMASNRVIGKDGDLAWRLPEDLKWFKRVTIGHPIIMGRKTMDSLPNGPLPKRRNVVISRSVSQGPEGFEMVGSCEEAIELLKDEEAIFVIGGAQIYAEMIPQCDEVLLSYVFHLQHKRARFYIFRVFSDWKPGNKFRHYQPVFTRVTQIVSAYIHDRSLSNLLPLALRFFVRYTGRTRQNRRTERVVACQGAGRA